MLLKDIPKYFNISSYLLDDCNIKKGRKDKIAIYYKEVSYTYGEVNDKVNNYANYLKQKGVKKADKIGLYMHDCPEFVFLFLGAIKAGIVPVIINAKLDLDVVSEITRRTALKYLYTTQELATGLKGIEDISYGVVISIQELVINNVENSFIAEKTQKDDTAFILFTSGSSGKPKGVMHRHDSIVSTINIVGSNVLKATENDVFYCHSAMSFAFGLGSTLYLPFAEGAATILNDDDSIYEIKTLVEKYNVTYFIAVPSVYLSFLQLFKDSDTLFPFCKMFIASGEPLSKKLAQDWKERIGKDICSVFGQTETLHMVIANQGGAKYFGCLGKPLPGYEVRVENEEGALVKTNEIGHMFIKGPGFMSGYWDNPELTVKVLQDGWLATGDMVYFNADGYLCYSGRNSDTFKVNGVWQSAIPIEEAILEQGEILECVVCNEINDERNMDIVAYLVADGKNDYDTIVSDIRKIFFKKRMRTLCPRTFYFTDSMPKGTTGKIKRGSVSEATILKRI